MFQDELGGFFSDAGLFYVILSAPFLLNMEIYFWPLTVLVVPGKLKFVH